MDREPKLVRSRHSGPVSRQRVTVQLEIYRSEDDPGWILEVVNGAGTSIVWDDPFDTDDAAHAAFLATVTEEGMAAFLDETDVVPLPGRR